MSRLGGSMERWCTHRRNSIRRCMKRIVPIVRRYLKDTVINPRLGDGHKSAINQINTSWRIKSYAERLTCNRPMEVSQFTITQVTHTNKQVTECIMTGNQIAKKHLKNFMPSYVYMVIQTGKTRNYQVKFGPLCIPSAAQSFYFRECSMDSQNQRQIYYTNCGAQKSGPYNPERNLESWNYQDS